MDSAAGNPYKRRRVDTTLKSNIVLDPDVLEVLYVKFISACNLPLRLVSCLEFRAFLHYLNPDINTWLPGNYKTIRG